MARPRGRPSKSTTPAKNFTSSSSPRRHSKRARTSLAARKSSASTPKKSIYFEKDSEEPSESESEVENEESGYEDDGQSAAVSSASEPASEPDEEDEIASDESSSRKRKRGDKPFKSTATKVKVSAKGKELWRDGVEADLEPGQELFIELPKARKPGSTSYKDNTIHPNTLLFLGDLKRNNDRIWLKHHDPDYRQSQKDFSGFVECLSERLIERDETIPELPPKDLVFRIYRDVRFSKNPTPYKTHFSAAWSRTGRKGPYAAYYVQIAPGHSFVGGGLWHPEAPPLSLLRRNVDLKSHKLKGVLLDSDIRKEFLGGVENDEQKAVKAFCGHNAENALKRKPSGYSDDNPNINLLRLKNYTIGRKLKDDEVLGPKGFERISELLGVLTPFISHLNSVVMPDGEGGSTDGESEESAADDTE